MQASIELANNSDASGGIAYYKGTLYYLGGSDSIYAMNIENQEPYLLYDELEQGQDLIYFNNYLYVADGKDGILEF
jgi:hypothetical protein